jgi:hypothetical protein
MSDERPSGTQSEYVEMPYMRVARRGTGGAEPDGGPDPDRGDFVHVQEEMAMPQLPLSLVRSSFVQDTLNAWASRARPATYRETSGNDK